MDKRLLSHLNWSLLACTVLLFFLGVGNLFPPAPSAWRTG